MHGSIAQPVSSNRAGLTDKCNFTWCPSSLPNCIPFYPFVTHCVPSYPKLVQPYHTPSIFVFGKTITTKKQPYYENHSLKKVTQPVTIFKEGGKKLQAPIVKTARRRTTALAATRARFGLTQEQTTEKLVKLAAFEIQQSPMPKEIKQLPPCLVRINMPADIVKGSITSRIR